jgi:hypothetical protein
MSCPKNSATCGHQQHSSHGHCHGKHRSRDPKHISSVSADSLIEMNISEFKNFDVHLNHPNVTFKIKSGKLGRKGIIIFQNTTAADLCIKDVQVCGNSEIATCGAIFPVKLVPEQILFAEYYFSSLALVLRLRWSCMAQELIVQTLVLEGTNAAIATFQKNVTSAVTFNVADFNYSIGILDNGTTTTTTYTPSDVSLETNGSLRIVANGNDTSDWSAAGTTVTVTYAPVPQSDCGSVDCSLVSDWIKSFENVTVTAA